jgi:hypothetical protein
VAALASLLDGGGLPAAVAPGPLLAWLTAALPVPALAAQSGRRRELPAYADTAVLLAALLPAVPVATWAQAPEPGWGWVLDCLALWSAMAAGEANKRVDWTADRALLLSRTIQLAHEVVAIATEAAEVAETPISSSSNSTPTDQSVDVTGAVGGAARLARTWATRRGGVLEAFVAVAVDQCAGTALRGV